MWKGLPWGSTWMAASLRPPSTPPSLSQYIRELADSQGLTVIGHIGVPPPAIFDGQSLVWAESPWWLVNLVKAVWRWGLNPWLLQRSVGRGKGRERWPVRLPRSSAGE